MSDSTTATAALRSIPALLARNARDLGGAAGLSRKGIRHLAKLDLGRRPRPRSARWRLGLLALGLDRGDQVAIIGRNRPALYWSMVAAQMCGAIPVPLYQDAVAEEMAYVLDHCGARFVVCGDQEQVDKVIEVGDRCTHIEQIVYLDKRGMRKYDHAAHERAGRCAWPRAAPGITALTPNWRRGSPSWATTAPA